MNEFDIGNYIIILIFIVLPILTGFIASRRGRSFIIWALLTFFSCGICIVVIFFLPRNPKYEMGFADKERNMITKQQIQRDIDFAEMETMVQMNNIAEQNSITQMNNNNINNI